MTHTHVPTSLRWCIALGNCVCCIAMGNFVFAIRAEREAEVAQRTAEANRLKQQLADVSTARDDLAQTTMQRDVAIVQVRMSAPLLFSLSLLCCAVLCFCFCLNITFFVFPPSSLDRSDAGAHRGDGGAVIQGGSRPEDRAKRPHCDAKAVRIPAEGYGSVAQQDYCPQVR